MVQTNHKENSKLQENQTYVIGDLAENYGVTLRALRFYEDKGLLSPHRDGNVRIYTNKDCSRLEIILRGKRVGLTLLEIKEMIEWYEVSDLHMNPKVKAKIKAKYMEQIEILEEQKEDIVSALIELRELVSDLN